MTTIATAMNRLFDLLCTPFGGSAGWAVAVLSVLTGVIMLLLFKWSTNQDKLVAARQVLTGRIYEMGLYQDHLSVLGKIQKDLALANLKYIRWSLPALLVVIPPMIFILAQMDARFGHRPFEVGESALVTVTVEEGQTALLDELQLQASEGVLVATRPLRDPAHNLARWRIRVEDLGEHRLRLQLPGGPTVTKELVAGDGAPRLAKVREKESLRRALLNPAESPLDSESPIHSIALTLPGRELHYGPAKMNWLVALIAFSMAAGLALKDVFKVRM